MTGAPVRRGGVYDAALPGAGRHPVVVLTRDVAVPVLTSVVVALVTSTVRGIPSEVPLGPECGLTRDSVVNCDNLFTVPKSTLVRHRGDLGPAHRLPLPPALTMPLALPQHSRGRPRPM